MGAVADLFRSTFTGDRDLSDKIIQGVSQLAASRSAISEQEFVLKGGKKFWALARTGKSAELKGNDQVNGYLLLATSCGGTLATTATPTTVPALTG